MLLRLLACAATDIALCEPSGHFVLPEPDLVVLDGDGRLSVQVEGECLGDDSLVVRAGRVDEDPAGVEMTCDGADPLMCTATSRRRGSRPAPERRPGPPCVSTPGRPTASRSSWMRSASPWR